MDRSTLADMLLTLPQYADLPDHLLRGSNENVLLAVREHFLDVHRDDLSALRAPSPIPPPSPSPTSPVLSQPIPASPAPEREMSMSMSPSPSPIKSEPIEKTPSKSSRNIIPAITPAAVPINGNFAHCVASALATGQAQTHFNSALANGLHITWVSGLVPDATTLEFFAITVDPSRKISDQAKEMAEMPIQRNLPQLLRAGRKIETIHKTRNSYIDGIIAYIVGVAANTIFEEGCGGCAKTGGQFGQCVIVPGERRGGRKGAFLLGACASCHFSCVMRRCEFWEEEADEGEHRRHYVRKSGW
ncbi:hypothetical protein G7Y89_g8148 [Cudoniella acicularis]|uniref:Uncharacterized protein n=1 Tax=Cudoniella acicularis TaxID=354080 RepID=A0A8H4RJ76_9HELO|nr:hypothetical protein G7Y89_g8148 [Cudoniella acicularis]